MNFNEIKLSIESNHDNLTIPITIKDIKRSQFAINKINRHMKIEALMQILYMLLFLSAAWILPMHKIARGIYFYSILVCCALSTLYLISMFKFCNKQKALNLNSKDTLQNYLTELKITLATYKTALTAVSISLILPVYMTVIGTTNSSPERIMSFLMIDYTTFQFTIFIFGFSSLVLFMNWTTQIWSNHLYVKHAKHVEHVLEQYMD